MPETPKTPWAKPFLPILGAYKKILNKMLFQIFFLATVLWSKRKVFANFLKNINFFRSLWLFESENFALNALRARKNSRARKLTPTNIPDRQQRARFQKSKQILYHSTLIYCTVVGSMSVLSKFSPNCINIIISMK